MSNSCGYDLDQPISDHFAVLFNTSVPIFVALFLAVLLVALLLVSLPTLVNGSTLSCESANIGSTFSCESDNDYNFLNKFEPCTQEELADIIKSSKISTSHSDPLPSCVLKECVGDMLPYLTILVNSSLSQGSMDGTKEAIIRPLLKKANLDYNKFSNFRPISNLLFVSKLIERVVLKRLDSHMAKNNLHIDSQYGYKKHHSTESLLLHFLDEILVAVDKKLGVVVLIIDLSAAFDTVNHHILIKILSNEIGVRGTALQWFKSFLCGRMQRVKVGNGLSEPLELSFGVPQGSVLGPVLFNIYMRSISNVYSSHSFSHHGYADDNSGTRSFSSVFQYQVLLNDIPDIISELKSWMKLHFLMLNESKTEIIVFQNNLQHPINGTFTNSGKCIRFSSVAKYLGVYLDSSLDFVSHINHITSECYMYIRKIKSIRKYLSQHECEILVHAFISSRVDLCNALFFGLPKSTLLKLQRIQNSAVRIIYNLKKRDSVKHYLKSLHWLDIEQRIVYKTLLFVFKCIHGYAPFPLNSLIVVKDTPSLSLDVKTFFPSSKFGRRAFRYSAPRLWNCLPHTIRLSVSIDVFKKNLKHHLFINLPALMEQYYKYIQ